MINEYLKELILHNFGLNPTADQAKVIDSLCQFILSPDASSIFLLRGFAGTGKTTLISALVKTMKQLERECTLIAPTGRAAKVFSLYADHPAFTIHKRIYRQKSIDKDSIFTLNYNMRQNILFICGGAFETLDKIIAQRVNKGGMGFGADIRSEKDNTLSELFQQLEPDDLIRFGLIPEIVGRLPIAVALEELDESALLNILTQPKNALVKQFKSLFEMDGIELSFTDDALKEIVHETMSRKTGARGLRSVMERTLQKAMFTMPGSDVKKLVVTADTVKKGLAVASEEASPEDNSVEFGGVADLSESEFVKDSPRRGRKKAS